MPLLPRRHRPQHADAAVPLRHERCGMAGHRAGAARSGMEGLERVACPAGRCRRDYVDAIRYLVKEGIQWRAMPADLPHWRTVYDVADGWHTSGATAKMHYDRRRQCRIAAGRTPEPTAAVIDSQLVKAAEEVCRASRGYDAGKKVNGQKLRHIAVDTIGLLLTVLITAAGIQDRDAAKPLLWNLRRAFPSIKLAWADGGYAGNSSPGPGPRSSPG